MHSHCNGTQALVHRRDMSLPAWRPLDYGVGKKAEPADAAKRRKAWEISGLIRVIGAWVRYATASSPVYFGLLNQRSR